MNEVKIYKLSPDGFDEVSEDQVNYDFDDDLFLVDLADFQSERAARIAAETKLAELEDENKKLKKSQAARKPPDPFLVKKNIRFR